MKKIFAHKGPVYVDGKLICTLIKDVYWGDVAMAETFILPDGKVPEAGNKMDPMVDLFVCGDVEFTQDPPDKE